MFDVSITRAFYDREAVIKEIGKQEAKFRMRAGARTRAYAQRSIHEAGQNGRGNTSSPGKPPVYHPVGDSKHGALRDFIWFAHDSVNKTTLVGPVRLDSKTGTAPKALEYGGSSIKRGYWRKRTRQFKSGKVGQWKERVAEKRVHIRERPFMRPALAAVMPEFSEMWLKSIT